MVMSAKLDICLRVLIPAAENNVAGNSFRPGVLEEGGGREGWRKGVCVFVSYTRVRVCVYESSLLSRVCVNVRVCARERGGAGASTRAYTCRHGKCAPG